MPFAEEQRIQQHTPNIIHPTLNSSPPLKMLLNHPTNLKRFSKIFHFPLDFCPFVQYFNVKICSVTV